MMKFKIGQKIRIIKCCAPFFGEELLGKVDYINKIYENGNISLEKYNLNVLPNWIKIINENDIDTYLKLNKKTIQQI